MPQVSYEDFKNKLDIMPLALDAGFMLNKRAGINTKYPEMIRDIGRGETETIVLTSNHKGWFKHSGEKGNLIGFVKKYMDDLQEKVPEISATDSPGVRINKILSHYANIPVEKAVTGKSYLEKEGYRNAVPFNINRYQVEDVKEASQGLMSIFRYRGINAQTVETFAPFIKRIVDKESQVKIKNMAFPYTVPGQDKIVGMEIRGFGGYKAKAAGSDSTNALWIADFTGGKPEKAEKILFFEGAYDAMAFYQANSKKIELNKMVLASTGGTPSNKQINNMLSYYHNALPVAAFDNDLNGKIYSLRLLNLYDRSKHPESLVMSFNTIPAENMAKVTYGDIEKVYTEKDLTLFNIRNDMQIKEKVGEWKAPSRYKDWNDAIRNITIENLKAQKATKAEQSHRQSHNNKTAYKR